MLRMLRAFGQPVQRMSQHHATMLQDVALKCCERLARPLSNACAAYERTRSAENHFEPPLDCFCYFVIFCIAQVYVKE